MSRKNLGLKDLDKINKHFCLDFNQGEKLDKASKSPKRTGSRDDKIADVKARLVSVREQAKLAKKELEEKGISTKISPSRNLDQEFQQAMRTQDRAKIRETMSLRSIKREKDTEAELKEELEKRPTSLTNDWQDKLSSVFDLSSDTDVIYIFFPEGIFCANRRELLQQANEPENLLADWRINDSASEWQIQRLHGPLLSGCERSKHHNLSVMNEGYGGKAGDERYFKLPIGPINKVYVDGHSILNLLTDLDIMASDDYDISTYTKNPEGISYENHAIIPRFYYAFESKRERIGNINSIFEIGGIHGQAPDGERGKVEYGGEKIYSICALSEAPFVESHMQKLPDYTEMSREEYKTAQKFYIKFLDSLKSKKLIDDKYHRLMFRSINDIIKAYENIFLYEFDGDKSYVDKFDIPYVNEFYKTDIVKELKDKTEIDDPESAPSKLSYPKEGKYSEFFTTQKIIDNIPDEEPKYKKGFFIFELKKDYMVDGDKKVQLLIQTKHIIDRDDDKSSRSVITSIRYQRKGDKLGNYTYKKAGWAYETKVDTINSDKSITASVNVIIPEEIILEVKGVSVKDKIDSEIVQVALSRNVQRVPETVPYSRQLQLTYTLQYMIEQRNDLFAGDSGDVSEIREELEYLHERYDASREIYDRLVREEGEVRAHPVHAQAHPAQAHSVDADATHVRPNPPESTDNIAVPLSLQQQPTKEILYIFAYRDMLELIKMYSEQPDIDRGPILTTLMSEWIGFIQRAADVFEKIMHQRRFEFAVNNWTPNNVTNYLIYQKELFTNTVTYVHTDPLHGHSNLLNTPINSGVINNYVREDILSRILHEALPSIDYPNGSPVSDTLRNISEEISNNPSGSSDTFLPNFRMRRAQVEQQHWTNEQISTYHISAIEYLSGFRQSLGEGIRKSRKIKTKKRRRKRKKSLKSSKKRKIRRRKIKTKKRRKKISMSEGKSKIKKRITVKKLH